MSTFTLIGGYVSPKYSYLRADGVAVAHPLFQGEGGGSIPTSALQLRFTPIGVDTALELNALWHSAMPNLSAFAARCYVYSQCYVAEFENGWFAVAIWSSPPALNRMTVEAPEEIIELRRFAIAPQAPKNTATRMLAWMVRDLKKRYPELRRFISYQAEAIHKGTIYRAAGWTPVARAEFRPWAVSGKRSGSKAAQVDSPKVRWELAA